MMVYETLKVIENVLDILARRKTRIRVFYGDPVTGLDWCEENHTMGYVGRSIGVNYRHLLMPTKTSESGHIIHTEKIVKITAANGGELLYRHKGYHHGVWEIGPIAGTGRLSADGAVLTVGVYQDKVHIANFTSEEKAKRFINFITGVKNTK